MLRRFTLLSVIVLAGVLLGAAPALAESGLAPSPARMEFGQVDVHFGGSPRQSVQFMNNSPMSVTIFAVAVNGPDANSFQVVNDNCSSQTISMSPASCAVEVQFEPGTTVAKNATLELLTSEGSVSVPLSGEGITGTLSANPSPLSFSPIPYAGAHSGEGNQNETDEVTIRDGARAGVHIEAVGITGPDASSFSVQWSGCGNDLLGPNNTCTMGIRFEPVSPGLKHAQLQITSDSSSGPLTIALEGEGLFGPKISLSSSQALLGEVLLGSSTWQTFTLTNTGDYPLGVQQAFLVSGTPLMFPVLSDTCNEQIVYPGASCAVTVGFRPTTPGEKDASILFITSSSLPVNVVGIDGIGVQPATSPPPSPPTPLSAVTPAPVAKEADAWSQWLTLWSPARLYGVGGGETLETGVGARCPARSHPCKAESFITAAIPTGAIGKASRSAHRTSVLLGASTIQLQGGVSTRVHIPLSAHAISLLEERSRLRATVEFVIEADGKIVATHTRAVTLMLPVHGS